MGELKHGFGAAKMNKDADERLVPNGEYRDALNIEIATSEGSDVGSMQTILGNTEIISTTITATISNSAKVVGSIADEQNNTLYYFVYDPDNYTDYILQYNSDTKTLIPVVVDKYQIEAETSFGAGGLPGNINTHFLIHQDPNNPGQTSLEQNLTNVRPGMKVISRYPGAFQDNATPPNSLDVDESRGWVVSYLKEDLYSGAPNAIPSWQVHMDVVSPPDPSATTTVPVLHAVGISAIPGEIVTFKAERVLNFQGNIITGINIINGILFWTDGETEPKKVIVKNYINEAIPGRQGTAANGELHSFFNVYTPMEVVPDIGVVTVPPANLSGIIEHRQHPKNYDERRQPAALEEEHLTVIKKPPLHPPVLIMSNTSDSRFKPSGSSARLEGTLLDFFIDNEGENLEVGSVKDITFTNNLPDYIVGDLVILRKDIPFNNPSSSLSEFEIIIEILTPLLNGSTSVKINFIRQEPVNALLGPNETAGVDPPQATEFYSMLQQEKPLYEFKLPKFAYRYKYQDNQYSPYSPFSEVAFLPGNFLYEPKEGYNLGMVNTLRSLYIADFVPDAEAIPKDVIEIDILYKESNSTNIYVVKTIKYESLDINPDSEWFAIGSVMNTDAWKGSRTFGALLITSEMVKSAVASNQLIRPWDNVPRAAKAQEIVGNRIVYANYLQNYNL